MKRVTGVVGLDLSLRGTGFARIDMLDGTLETWTFGTKEGSGSTVKRAKEIGMKILNVMQPTDFVFLEDYAFSIRPKASSVVTLGELGGVVKLLLSQFTGLMPFTLTTSEMRKFVSGHGDLKKEMIPVWTYKRYGREMHSHDECVASVLADMGTHIMEVNQPQYPVTTKNQADIIKRLHGKYLGALQALALDWRWL
jgi:Holliday junction resolvasome RuvABC endonuclease subunit